MNLDILGTVTRITKEVGDAWQGKRAEPSTDWRIRGEVDEKIRSAISDIDIVVDCAREAESVAKAISSCATEEAVDEAVLKLALPSISALTGLVQACNDAAHTIWENQYHPLEMKL